ncbi:hypothetical protein DRW03_24640 [Corallococcus sp. H22C18031201]|uniref:DUF6484 domain-containing protein n=1 Tax=Citreicoccus inhibens TaxID=2849499 RepID=UPI000E71B97F|nr:DUF6484 domain-containing protein [Citreicoccus inhibens]MBU8900272.1 hypothetical protein [Citreicoccus inhibens]RJS18327.1 hypothetical protein DRW03_24640 [Corallococcus sp. H22C18031201]
MPSREQDKQQAALDTDEPILGNLVGWVTGLGAKGTVQVDFEGNRRGPIEARLATPANTMTLSLAVQRRQGVVLCFERGLPSRPLILGFVQEPSETPLLDELLSEPQPGTSELVVNGKRFSLDSMVGESADEISLRCGKASLVLRRNGQVLIRGEDVKVDAGRVLRLRGGKTQIN